MKFEMWSFGHIFFMLSPFLFIIPLYYILRKRSSKTIYWVGVVIGILSLGAITTRSIYYYSTHGFHPQEIPLQVCHFGNIMVFIALIFRSKIASCVAWCLNMPAAYSSLVLADSLAKYPTIWNVLPQMYIWGHFFIVVGAIYPIILKEIRLDRKSFLLAIGVIFMLLIPSIILNSYFNDIERPGKDWFINYFYIYNSKGVPFEFIYDLGTRAKYGWFTINWVYTILLILIFLPIVYGFYCLQKLFYRKNKEYTTHNIFYRNKKQIN